MTIERTAWFCPACQKHHAPHVETCPGPVEVRPLPGITVPPVHPVMPYRWEPNGDTPWMPVYPVVTCIGGVADQGTVIVSGVATTRGMQ